MTVPYTFANQTGSIPLSELDANFSNVSNYSSSAGTVVGNAQPNITSVGVLSNLSVTGSVVAGQSISAIGNVTGGNVTGGNLRTAGSVSAVGNIVTDQYFVGTFFGNVTGNFVVPGSNTQVIFNTSGNADAVSAMTFNKDSNTFTVLGVMSSQGNIIGGNVLFGSGVVSGTGNITGNYILGNGSQLTGLAATYGNANVVANLAALGSNPVSTAGNVTAGNILFGSGVVSGTGNVTGNVIIATTVSASGNVTGAYILGNGSQLTGLAATYGNANVVANLAALGSNPISTSGNITGGNVLFGSGVVSGTGNVSGNVGTFTTHNGTTFSASGNITGGNVLFGSGIVSGTGNISGNLITATTLNATTISASGNVTGGNLSVGTGIVSIGNLVNNNANGVGNIGSATTYFNTVFAQATSAQYADLAENYLADAPYVSGTVVSIGGDAEVTQSSVDADGTVIGVVSTNPAYHMNAGLAGGYVVAVALTGRVPCRVTGSVKRGSAMVSNGDGTARAEESPAAGTIIGKALTSFNGATGVIEVVVGRF